MTGAVPAGEGHAGGQGRFLVLLCLLTLFAALTRLLYFMTAQVDVPLRGDVLEYWNYANNLVNHQVFSAASPGEPVQPDSFRGPAYPAFLAVWIWLAGTPERALLFCQSAQIALGSLLVPATALLGRRWVGTIPALLAGLMVALWPHMVVFSSTLLSETFLACMLLGTVWALCKCQDADSRAWAGVAGIAAGIAYLTSPVLLFFPLAVALLLWLRGQRRVGLVLLASYLLIVMAWQVRCAAVVAESTQPGRATINLVQGSWPLYHAAYNDRARNPIARSVFNAIDEEVHLLASSPRAGLESMAARFKDDPTQYLSWYLIQKPYLLWDWNIRVGWGDVYFLETRGSPYERNSMLRGVHKAFKSLNPLFFGIAALASLTLLLTYRSARDRPFAGVLVAGLFVYLTAVHVVFQAEPRYAVAYRPLEVLLVVWTLSTVLVAIRSWRTPPKHA